MKNQLYESIVTYTYHADIYCYLALDNSRNFLGFRLPKQASINAFFIMYAKSESACGRGVVCLLPPHKNPTHGFTPQRYCFFLIYANFLQRQSHFMPGSPVTTDCPTPFTGAGQSVYRYGQRLVCKPLPCCKALTSMPQAARMSSPRERRMVVVIPFALR